MYQLVVFDWDGTLMDSTLKIANCIRASAEDADLPKPSIEQAKQIIGLGLHECMSVLFPDASEAQRALMVDRYKYHFVTGDGTEQALFQGVESGLRLLEEQGVLMAVATGKSRVGLDRAFSVTSVSEFFTVTRCADESRTKPHPQMLHEILDFTAIDANKAIMIGDTAFDIEMAQAAGIDSLGVTYGAHDQDKLDSHNPTHLVSSVSGVFSWLSDGKLEKAYE